MITLKLLNSLWFNENILNYNDNLLSHLCDNYDLSSFKIMFDKNSSSKIENWTEKQINNSIDVKIPIDDEQILIILNTIYFKDEWKESFDPSLTYKDLFNVCGSKSVECEFIRKSLYNQAIYEDEICTSLKIPLKNVGNMYFVIPNDGVSFDEIISNLNSVITSKEKQNLNIDFHVPKFNFVKLIDIKKQMQNMGILDIFNEEKADFKPFADINGIYADKLNQASAISVDEYGCEVASYTFASVSGSPKIDKIVKIDKPFIFTVVSNEGIILTIGLLNDPKQH